MSRDTVWALEPHTAAKHEILRRYLGAWFSILGKHNRRLIYVDGFCGPGRYIGGEQGSPLVAIHAAESVSRVVGARIEFYFIDCDSDRIRNLESEISLLGLRQDYRIRPILGEFGKEFPALLASIRQVNRQAPPMFVFIDPFGFSGIPFHIVKQILSQQRSEAFVLLNTDELRRFITHPNSKIKAHIESTFGTPEVHGIPNRSSDRLLAIRELYQRQLASCASFVRYFEMLDRNGADIYHLFFATNNALGFEKMKDAMWAVDETGAFRFSDQTDPNQGVLIGSDATADLSDSLRVHFAGREVDAAIVRQWALEQTIYLRRHVTAALRSGEQEGWILVDDRKRDGSRRLPRSFPDGTVVRFGQG